MQTDINVLSAKAFAAAKETKEKSAAINTGATLVYQTGPADPSGGDIDTMGGAAAAQAEHRSQKNVDRFGVFPQVGTKLSPEQASVLNQADQTIAYASNPGLMPTSGIGGMDPSIPGNVKTASAAEIQEFRSKMASSGAFSRWYPGNPEQLWNEIILPTHQKAASMTDTQLRELATETNFFDQCDPELRDMKPFFEE
jgi:hypothetical protein